MFNINWLRLLRLNVPESWRTPIKLAWLDLCMRPLYLMWTVFLNFKTGIDNILNYNSQIVSLEKRLNDKYAPVLRGIYIDNLADKDRIWIYKKVVQRPKFYIYKKWSAIVNYAENDRIVRGVWVYAAEVGHIGQDPDIVFPLYWSRVKKRPFIRTKADYDNQFDFVVFVPVAVVFDLSEMKAEINRYKYAGLRYYIQTY